MRLVDADKLAEQVANLEAVALEQVAKLEPSEEHEKWKVWSAILNERTAFKFDLFDAPTVDAEPVKHGHWILDKRGNYACEFCGNTPYHSDMHNMNYCPNCGAKLTIERDNITTHLIWNEPTVDAVEVVRCKDCKYHLNSNEKCGLFNTRLHFYEMDKMWTEDCFCSWGERKEDADT